MWSGPRNISTAMMRSFGSRPDTAVTDEPLYAHYLVVTGIQHPGRSEVIAAQENDWRKVTETLVGPVPGGRSICYQKHMAHHLLPVVGREWLDRLTHAFLIREPDEMLASLLRSYPEAGLADTGLPQQWEIFERVTERLGHVPPVVLSSDILRDPQVMLTKLCVALGIPFLPAMLSWAPGRRDTDGVWAPHWYAAVEASTGFETWKPRPVSLPGSQQPLLSECRRWYEKLHRYRLKP
ncbi:MAG: HAD family hydrolase [Gammaproteobacteria bacterium]|nr:HAD family hydrolase [Gammaproteobacteria bacterium]